MIKKNQKQIQQIKKVAILHITENRNISARKRENTHKELKRETYQNGLCFGLLFTKLYMYFLNDQHWTIIWMKLGS